MHLENLISKWIKVMFGDCSVSLQGCLSTQLVITAGFHHLPLTSPRSMCCCLPSFDAAQCSHSPVPFQCPCPSMHGLPLSISPEVECHKIPCYSSWNKPTQSYCQTLWIHGLSEREFLIVYLFSLATSKKSSVVPLGTYLYICQLRIRWRFSWGFAEETQRKQCSIHTELHWLQALSLPSSSSVTELPWSCPSQGLMHTGYSADKH